VKVDVVTRHEDFVKLKPAWDSVLEKSAGNDVFLTFEWFDTWWLAFGKAKCPMVIVVKNGHDVAGIAPLAICRTRFMGLPVRMIGFMENDNSPHCDFILSRSPVNSIYSIVRYLKRSTVNWDLICLRNIPKSSATCAVLADTLKRNRMLFAVEEGLHSPFIEIDRDWQTYFGSRSWKFRKVLRNKLNRMKRLGHYEIQEIDQVDDPRKVLDSIFGVSRNSWKGRCRKDVSGIREVRRFFEVLSEIAAQRHWLKIWLMSVNGQPVAYEYHLKYKQREHALRGDFDERCRNNHPGSVLDAHIVERLFENGLEEYDMGGGNDYYKRRWTSTVREHCTFAIFKNTAYGTLLYLLRCKAMARLRKIHSLRVLRDKLSRAIRPERS
jgi:CelD/BcsL family acetyltransferase involved in cellulose biosynthesis